MRRGGPLLPAIQTPLRQHTNTLGGTGFLACGRYDESQAIRVHRLESLCHRGGVPRGGVGPRNLRFTAFGARLVAWLLLTPLLGAAALDGAAGGGEVPERFRRAAAHLVESLKKGDYEAAERDFAPRTRQALPPPALKAFFGKIERRLGPVRRLGPGKLAAPNEAVFDIVFERGTQDLKLILNDKAEIIGLLVVGRVPALPTPKENQTPLSLPFRGRWFVAWGGDTRKLNQHHDNPGQRFAFDFVVVDERGKTHRGDGKRNDDYYAFGREILAPADGVVTDVIRGVRDNVPGSMNPYSALGNAVLIQHSPHEVSVLAHFKQGSIRVRAGQKVRRGQVLGLCGNSGNSSEPHLHYHLQNTPIIQDATGIKCYFRDVVVTRGGRTERKKRYSPIKGDIVSPQ